MVVKLEHWTFLPLTGRLHRPPDRLARGPWVWTDSGSKRVGSLAWRLNLDYLMGPGNLVNGTSSHISTMCHGS